MLKKTLLSAIVFMACCLAMSAQVEFVDLGLSVDWATCNLGADSPEQPGAFFAWSEVQPKEDYSMKTHKYIYHQSLEDMLWKYDPQYQNHLEPEDDAATVMLGRECHTPTLREWKELRAKCKFVWTKRNKVEGYQVTGPNGASIFLPVTGIMHGSSLSYTNRGYYMSSVLIGDLHAAWIWMSDGVIQLANSHASNARLVGQSVDSGIPVRAVKTKK